MHVPLILVILFLGAIFGIRPFRSLLRIYIGFMLCIGLVILVLLAMFLSGK